MRKEKTEKARHTFPIFLNQELLLCSGRNKHKTCVGLSGFPCCSLQDHLCAGPLGFPCWSLRPSVCVSLRAPMLRSPGPSMCGSLWVPAAVSRTLPVRVSEGPSSVSGSFLLYLKEKQGSKLTWGERGWRFGVVMVWMCPLSANGPVRSHDSPEGNGFFPPLLYKKSSCEWVNVYFNLQARCGSTAVLF